MHTKPPALPTFSSSSSSLIDHTSTLHNSDSTSWRMAQPHSLLLRFNPLLFFKLQFLSLFNISTSILHKVLAVPFTTSSFSKIEAFSPFAANGLALFFFISQALHAPHPADSPNQSARLWSMYIGQSAKLTHKEQSRFLLVYVCNLFDIRFSDFAESAFVVCKAILIVHIAP